MRKEEVMAGARELLTGLALVGALWAGCADVSAQEAKRTEHGVFEYSKLRLAHGDREVVRWSTAEKEVDVESVLALWTALGVDAQTVAPGSDRVRVLDRLAGQGWEVIDRTDVTVVLAGGTGISERYLLRREK
ncbi:MAG: hypothetical protein ACYTG3_17210 [Planctomycetota bacterium]|jgi:hypothetical protein